MLAPNLNKGFTLLELSVVLVVISLVLGASLTLGAARIEVANYNSTRDKLDAIEMALVKFVSQGGNTIVNGLPCPADGNLAPTNAAYGFSVANCSAVGYANIFTNGGDIIGGVVPTSSLFLPPEYMLDGWGQKFSYHIDRRFSLVANMQVDPAAGDRIVVKTTCSADCDNTPDVTNDITRNAIVVVLSHGPNGLGAWRRVPSGTTRRMGDPVDGDERANWALGCGAAVDANTCNAYDRTFIAKVTTTTYDDIVRFKQRWQLVPLDYNGGVIRHPTAACNRPAPNAAGVTGLATANLQPYACPDTPRRCVLSYVRSTLATSNACAIDSNGCYVDFTPQDEAGNNLLITPGGSGTIPMYMCIGRDGSPVLCRASASNPAATADLYRDLLLGVQTDYGRIGSVVTPVTAGGNCWWWQY